MSGSFLQKIIRMGLGCALSEQFVMEGGRTLNTHLLDYKMPNAMDMPPGDRPRLIEG
jgi:CO/xanthine dehydrogenase Mo-binding subunit